MGNCFAALPVRFPEPLFESIRAGAPPALRWFHPDDLHLTLAFLGPESPERLPAIQDALTRLPGAEFEITLGPLRLLPRDNRVTAISFAIERGRERAADFIAQWRPALLAAAGRPPDTRSAFPHLTIARPARKHPEFRPAHLRRWARSLTPPAHPLAVLPPALFGWSPDRPRRQFRIIAP